MRTKKQILRRIAAFITSLVFLFSVTSYQYTDAEEQTETEIVTEEETDVTVPDITSEAVTDIPVTEIPSDITEEVSEALQTEVSSSGRQEISIHIKVNGTSDIKPLNIIQNLFYQVNVTDFNKDTAVAEIACGKDLADLLWEKDRFSKGGKVQFTMGNVRYCLDSVTINGNEAEVCLTEYYDTVTVSMKEIKIKPSDINNQTNRYCAYGTKMSVFPSNGWVIDGDTEFELHGELLPYISIVGERHTLIIENGSEKIRIPLHRSGYLVEYPSDSGISAEVNGQSGSAYSGVWLDDDSINAEFTVNDGSDFKITGVFLVDSETGEKYPMDITGDGKNVSAHISAKLLKEVWCDKNKYRFEFETIKDYVKIDTYVIEDNEYEKIRIQKLETHINDLEVKFGVPPLLYENGISKYILDSYEVNGEKHIVDSKELYDNDLLNKDVMLQYDSKIKLIYKEIVQDINNNWNIIGSIYMNKKGVYSLTKSPVHNLIKYNRANNEECLVIYDIFHSNGLLEENMSAYGQSLVYIYPNDYEVSLDCLRTKSILYYENNEFHNMLNEPLYFYFDDHAPKITLTNTSSDTYDNSKWSRLLYRFTLRTDDRESFPQKQGAGDDVNEIYRNIDGAASEITKITVGKSVFVKKDGEWVLESDDRTEPYYIGVTEISENEFSIYAAISVDTDLRGIDRKIEVTAADSCGNTSAPEVFELKIDTEKPRVTSMKIRDAVHYTDPEYGRTAAVGMNITGGKFYIDMEAEDDFSGLGSVMITYGDYEETYTPEKLRGIKDTQFRQEDGKYYFSLPVSTDYCRRSDIKITLTDNAKNTDTFWYNDDQKPVQSENGGTSVIVDMRPPEAYVNSEERPAHVSADHKQWYRRIPEFKVIAEDDFENINSGIRYILFSVNGAEKMSEEIFSRTADRFRIVSEHSSADPDKADVYYTDGTQKVKITSLDLKDTDGVVKAEVTAFDAAGNVSATAFTIVNVDPDPPRSDTHFTVENENDNTRSFGTFINHGTTLRVKVSEPADRPSSGLKDAELYYAGEKYTCSFSSEKESTAEFHIPFDITKENAVSGMLKLVLRDNAENSFISDDLLSYADSELMVFENVPPEINDLVTGSIEKYIDSENNRWYSDDVSLHFKTDDAEKYDIYSGLKNTQIDINGQNIISADYRNKNRITPYDDHRFSTADVGEPDGRFEISVRTEDNAGNPAEYVKTVFVDKTAPKITGMSIEGAGSVPLSILNGVYALPYGYFFRDSCRVTVYAEDKNASSGLADITLGMYSYSGEKISSSKVSGSQLKYESGIYSAEFVIPEGFKGYIVTDARDNTENASEQYTPHGFITESGPRHADTSSATVTLPETDFRDRSGLPLYNRDVTAFISASDRFSGIGSIEWNMSEYGENVWKHISADKEGKISGDEAADFSVSERDSNLVVAANGKVISSSDKNASQVRIKMTDNSGNTSEDMKTYSIDRSAPEITVSYDSAESDSSSGIFRTPRTANVTVRERNFDQGKMSVIAAGNSGSVSYGKWVLVSGTAGTDSAVYRMPVTFLGDGDYRLNVEGTDMCDNSSPGYTSEQFTVDRTPPSLEIISSGAEKINGNYYSGSRTVTVRITEHNFDASRIRISGTKNGSESDYPEISSFKNEGDVHTAVIKFSENADYTLDISGEDSAGNVMESFSENFCVDSAVPEIVFDGVENKSANSGDISLRVNINDENITEDRISVKITGARRGDVTEGSGILERTDTGYAYVFSEFENTRETDDIYTVTVSAEDMADNRSSDSIVFSLNRFGSTYVFSDETIAISNTYINKPIDIVLHEINADMLHTESTMVKIIRDSEQRILVKGEDFAVHRSGGGGKWYDYTYVISSKNFEDDGAYQIIVCSEDEAGNMNANSIDDRTSALKFGVDRTPPKCTPLNVERNGAYRTEGLEVEFFCEDNILLESLDVFLNEENISDVMTVENGRCSFWLQSGSHPCDIRVSMTDIAGNDSDTVIDNILVSTSLIRVMIHRPAVRNTLKVSAAALVTGAAGGIAWRRRKKRESQYSIIE